MCVCVCVCVCVRYFAIGLPFTERFVKRSAASGAWLRPDPCPPNCS